MERLRVRGAWPGRVEVTAGWAKATVRPWNDDIDAASIRGDMPGQAEAMSDLDGPGQ